MQRVPEEDEPTPKRSRSAKPVVEYERMWIVEVDGLQRKIGLKKSIRDVMEDEFYSVSDALVLLETLVRENRFHHLKPGAKFSSFARYRGTPFRTDTPRWFSPLTNFWPGFLWQSTRDVEMEAKKKIADIPLFQIHDPVIRPGDLFYRVAGTSVNAAMLVFDAHHLQAGEFNNFRHDMNPEVDRALVHLLTNYVDGIAGFFNFDKFAFMSEEYVMEPYANPELWLRNPSVALSGVEISMFTADETFAIGRAYANNLLESTARGEFPVAIREPRGHPPLGPVVDPPFKDPDGFSLHYYFVPGRIEMIDGLQKMNGYALRRTTKRPKRLPEPLKTDPALTSFPDARLPGHLADQRVGAVFDKIG